MTTEFNLTSHGQITYGTVTLVDQSHRNKAIYGIGSTAITKSRAIRFRLFGHLSTALKAGAKIRGFGS